MHQSSLTGWLGKGAQGKPTVAQINCTASIPPVSATPSDIAGRWHLVGERSRACEAKGENASMVTRALPPNVVLRSCDKGDIQSLKQLNGLLLPIQYPESFYRDIIDDVVTNSITLVAVWHEEPNSIGKERGVVVGAIRCRLLAPQSLPSEQLTQVDKGPVLYLSTLVLLSPYRGHGIASHMLARVLQLSIREHGVTSIGAHVWEANPEGLEWYRKRGFREISREEAYYRRLRPSGAVVMRKKVNVIDHLFG